MRWQLTYGIGGPRRSGALHNGSVIHGGIGYDSCRPLGIFAQKSRDYSGGSIA